MIEYLESLINHYKDSYLLEDFLNMTNFDVGFLNIYLHKIYLNIFKVKFDFF